MQQPLSYRCGPDAEGGLRCAGQVDHTGTCAGLCQRYRQHSLRLQTKMPRLQQVVGTSPSQLRFTLRAHLVDSHTRKVLAWREFDQTMAAPSDDPRGGVAAANTAVQTVLGQLADFCAEASRALPPAAKAP